MLFIPQLKSLFYTLNSTFNEK